MLNKLKYTIRYTMLNYVLHTYQMIVDYKYYNIYNIYIYIYNNVQYIIYNIQKIVYNILNKIYNI